MQEAQFATCYTVLSSVKKKERPDFPPFLDFEKKSRQMFVLIILHLANSGCVSIMTFLKVALYRPWNQSKNGGLVNIFLLILKSASLSLFSISKFNRIIILSEVRFVRLILM